VHVPEILVIAPEGFVLQAAAFKVKGKIKLKNIKISINIFFIII
jgi:hypothetical protein